MLFNKQHHDMSTRKYNRIDSVFLIKILIMGLEVMIGRAPAILGWAYALLGPAVDTPLVSIMALYSQR